MINPEPVGRPGRRHILKVVLCGALVATAAGCGSNAPIPSPASSPSASGFSRVTTPARTEASSSAQPSATPVDAARCPLSLAQVQAITKIALQGPLFGALPVDGRCGYVAAQGGPDRFSLNIEPFPDSDHPPTLAKTEIAIRQIYEKGNAHDRATERILDEPSWGDGTFVDAYLIGLPAGTTEDVHTFAAKHMISLSILTNKLLKGAELTWSRELLALLPR